MNILLAVFVIQIVALYAMLLLNDYVIQPGSRYLAEQQQERRSGTVKMRQEPEYFRKAS